MTSEGKDPDRRLAEQVKSLWAVFIQRTRGGGYAGSVWRDQSSEYEVCKGYVCKHVVQMKLGVCDMCVRNSRRESRGGEGVESGRSEVAWDRRSWRERVQGRREGRSRGIKVVEGRVSAR